MSGAGREGAPPRPERQPQCSGLEVPPCRGPTGLTLDSATVWFPRSIWCSGSAVPTLLVRPLTVSVQCLSQCGSLAPSWKGCWCSSDCDSLVPRTAPLVCLTHATNRKASRPAAGWPVGRASGGCRGSRQSPRRSLEDFSCITEACEVGSVVFEPPLADDIRSLRDGAVPTPPHLGIPSPSLASAPPPQLPPQPSPTVTRRVAGPGR
jgi:hypothetical protein